VYRGLIIEIAQGDEVGLSLRAIRDLRAGVLEVQSHVEMPYVEIYHRDLDRLEAAGHAVDGYRIPPAWLVSRNVVDIYRGSGHPSHRWVDARFMRARVDALLAALSTPPVSA
jgi:hypothetical protein